MTANRLKILQKKMSSEENLLLEYVQKVEKIRKIGRDSNIPDEKINEIFKFCFAELKQKNTNRRSQLKYLFLKCFKLFIYIFCIIFIIYILLYQHQPTFSLVMRNVQGLIYPVLKSLRLLVVPIIKAYPSLTEIYDESCLVQNPYFLVPDMNCYPCENVHSVIDVTNFTNISFYQSGIPHTLKTNIKTVEFSHLRNLYENNQQIFDQDAPRVKSNNAKYKNVENVFSNNEINDTDHIQWRINRMPPARLLRKLFPKPHTISPWLGQSLERYILIDGAKFEPYLIPDLECSYIFIMQASGKRTILLRPSTECVGQCRTISHVLKPSEVLFYNWWYWRPVSIPFKNSNVTSVTFVGSYC